LKKEAERVMLEQQKAQNANGAAGSGRSLPSSGAGRKTSAGSA